MEVPRHWRLKKQRYALVGEICPHCKAPVFPPRAVCPYCRESEAKAAAVQEGFSGYDLQEQHGMAIEAPVRAVHAG